MGHFCTGRLDFPSVVPSRGGAGVYCSTEPHRVPEAGGVYRVSRNPSYHRQHAPARRQLAAKPGRGASLPVPRGRFTPGVKRDALRMGGTCRSPGRHHPFCVSLTSDFREAVAFAASDRPGGNLQLFADLDSIDRHDHSGPTPKPQQHHPSARKRCRDQHHLETPPTVYLSGLYRRI